METSQEQPFHASSSEAWPKVPTNAPITARAQNDQRSAIEIDIVLSPVSSSPRARSVLSMDDIEAAQALEGLRADSKVSSRQVTSNTLNSAIDPSLLPPSSESPHEQPEPLLSLLTSHHPLVATAINGSLSAYSTSKSFSPRFRQGAEFVERNIGSPVASTVSTAGRISGVETGVRWWLQRTDSNHGRDRGNKRRRMSDVNVDVEKGLRDVSLEQPPPQRQRTISELSASEELPPYDNDRSPTYEEQFVSRTHTQSPSSRTWRTRLVMSTSGLGVAMSEESLRSLKYCLSWLRWANAHLNNTLRSLQATLEEWQRSQDSTLRENGSHIDTNPPPCRDQAIITSHIDALKNDALQTLKSVIDVVSKYAGGALPENARLLVRRHLTSLPQRFRLANQNQSSSIPNTTSKPDGDRADEGELKASETVFAAQRVVVLAREGLDMMSQVSGVLDGTIESAEEWCERLGMKVGQKNGTTERQDGPAKEPQLQITGPSPPASDEKEHATVAQHVLVVLDSKAPPTSQGEIGELRVKI